MKIKYKPDSREYFLTSLKVTLRNKYLITIYLGLAIYFFISFNRQVKPETAPFLIREITILILSLFSSIVSWLLGILLIAISLIIRIRSNKNTFQEEIEYTFTNDNITSKGSFSSSQYNWNAVRNIKETKNIFFVNLKAIHTPLVYIPKRAFKDEKEIDQFENLLRSKKMLE